MLKTLLYLIVITHFVLLIAMSVCFIILPFLAPWYTALPLEVFIVRLALDRNPKGCPLTNLENSVRMKLGMKRIGGFIGYYILRKFRS